LRIVLEKTLVLWMASKTWYAMVKVAQWRRSHNDDHGSLEKQVSGPNLPMGDVTLSSEEHLQTAQN